MRPSTLMNYIEPCPTTGCWLWTGHLHYKVYATYRSDKAHRAMFRETRGAIPKGMHVLHNCDVRCCVQPAHLYLGTNESNIKDKCERDRSGKKLNIAKVKEIRQLHHEGVSQARLARRFGVHQSTISKAITGRQRWKHVMHAIGG